MDDARATRWMSGRGKVVLNAAGEVIGMVGIGEDITAQHHNFRPTAADLNGTIEVVLG